MARIIFTDLCALVRPSPQELDVLLVDARLPTPEQEAAGMHRHEPLLGVPIKHLSLDPANRPPDRLVPELGGDTLALFELSREELGISTPSLMDVVSYPLPLATPRSLLEEETLDWIAKVSPSPFSLATLHSACLGNLSTGPVISRVKITGGRVTCKRVIRADGQYRQFEFRSAPGVPPVGTRRALGDLVQVELAMPSTEENNGPQITSSSGIGISILSPADDSPVNLLVGNLGLDSQISLSEGVATHFRWFYELLQSPPSLMERLIPFASPLGPLTVRPTSPCPMIMVE
ncbi:MAG TPA: hypothetical protein VLB76_00190 [Thermoanaerobaculia bacterium]|nr:hypothetical protein [Thermoanaerobaculia bacterium]